MKKMGQLLILFIAVLVAIGSANAETTPWLDSFRAGLVEQQNEHHDAALPHFARAFAGAPDELNKSRIASYAAQSAAALGRRAEYQQWAVRAGSELSAEERARSERMLPAEVVVGARAPLRTKRWLGVGAGAIGAVALVGGAV